MNQITITREEFRKRIACNPEKFGAVRILMRAGEKENSTMLLAELINFTLTVSDIEKELFDRREEEAKQED